MWLSVALSFLADLHLKSVDLVHSYISTGPVCKGIVFVPMDELIAHGPARRMAFAIPPYPLWA